jgi:hypothetical protein
MREVPRLSIALASLLALAAAPALAQNFKLAERNFEHIDTDGDGRISRVEWVGRGNFEVLDGDGDGFLNLGELAGVYTKRPWGRYAGTPSPGGQDASIQTDKISTSDLPSSLRCALEVAHSCDINGAVARGLVATGTGPIFPENTLCPGIDDYFAMDYRFKNKKSGALHGGIDIPMPWDAPILAAAAGTVVGIYGGETSMRGREVNLRHSPEDTGLPFWSYTQYSHLNAMPDLQVGDKVAMGQFIGPSGNSGTAPGSQGGGGQAAHRRPAIHFAAWQAEGPRYADSGTGIIAENGTWLDPVAFYRDAPPFSSAELKSLPDDQKTVLVPVMTNDGTVLPAGAKRIWPYSCARK